MITIIKRGIVKPKYKAECPFCHSIFTFNSSDTSYVNVGYSNEEYITCPVCNNYDLIYEQWERIE